MTRDETKKLIMGIQCSYPNFNPRCDLGFMIDVWCDDLSEYDYEEVYLALKTYKATDTSGFAPSVGQLVDRMFRNRNINSGISEAEAWDMVRNAIADSTYHSLERFAALPENIQKAVGSPNQLRVWATDSGYSEGVTQSNFLKVYRQQLNKQTEMNKLPMSIQNMITQTSNKMIESKEM